MMEFDKSPAAYLDGIDNSFGLVDTQFDYLQYNSSPFMSSLTLGPQSSPNLSFNGLNITGAVPDFSPARPFTPADGEGVAPPLLGSGAYTLSAGELSSDTHSGTHSPPPHGYTPAVPRSHSRASRFDPIGVPPATRSSARQLVQRRRSTNSKSQEDSDEDDEEFQPTASTGKAASGTEMRRETIRKQRIESEQRRRDELRDGYAKLKDTLPASNQKSSKVSLLDRAVTHILQLETECKGLKQKVNSMSAEIDRLRQLNEQMMLSHATQVQRSTF